MCCAAHMQVVFGFRNTQLLKESAGGNAYANGRADDDQVAYVFDVTKLEEYVQAVQVVGTVTTEEAGA